MMLPPVDSMGNSVGSKGRTIFLSDLACSSAKQVTVVPVVLAPIKPIGGFLK